MSFDSEYQVDQVAATGIPADNIDATFRSSSIGEKCPTPV